ncbi:MAG TPA: ribokinase, partial [Polyangia bacterium]
MRSEAQSGNDLDVLVVGSVNTDYLATAPHLPRPGETVLGDAFQEAPGGKGANQAVAAARLGARTALIARVGADEGGRHAVESLGREHVATDGILRDETSPTGAALIMVDARGEKQILVAPGANGRLSAQDLEAAEILFARARAVLIQLEIPLETAIEAAHLGRAAGARVVLDPAPATPLPEDLLRDVHVLRPNAAEAAALTGLPVEDQASARHAAQNLMARGAGAVLVGAPGGNLLVSDEGDLWLPLLPVRSVDAT